MRFKVNIGYTRNGRERNRYFDSMEDASRFCSKVFDRTKIVLSIVAVPSYHDVSTITEYGLPQKLSSSIRCF